MWIENELKKDAEQIQHSIHALSRGYTSKNVRRSHMRENKENTTRFFMNFYDSIRSAEYDIYKQFSVLNKEPQHCTDLTYDLNEVRNSSNDLPHPRLLSELRHEYERRSTTRGREVDDDDDERASHRYIPYQIYCYIREKSEYCIRFQHTIRGRLFTLYFITFPESHISICKTAAGPTSAAAIHGPCAAEIAVYQTYAYKVFIWLSIISRMSDVECSEKLDIYFYMTPFKKERPSSSRTSTANARKHAILSAIHVNTGLTRNCERHGEIVVYRAEEWFKVFVHESIHNFNIDFIDSDLRGANTRLRESFCIPHDDILLFEAYTESWARIINIMMLTYFSGNEYDRANFIQVVREKLTQNALFHVYQMVKALDVMDLKYAQITVLTPENMAMCRKRYAEDTNVYAYYIFGGILSAYALPFICWCCDHNTSSVVRFKQTDKNLRDFTDLICDASRDSTLVSMIEYIEKASASASGSASVLKKTMRMTLE
jgi:hypothetical protein